MKHGGGTRSYSGRIPRRRLRSDGQVARVLRFEARRRVRCASGNAINAEISRRYRSRASRSLVDGGASGCAVDSEDPCAAHHGGGGDEQTCQRACNEFHDTILFVVSVSLVEDGPSSIDANPGDRGLPGFCPAVHPGAAWHSGGSSRTSAPPNGEAGTLAANSKISKQGTCQAETRLSRSDEEPRCPCERHGAHNE